MLRIGKLSRHGGPRPFFIDQSDTGTSRYNLIYLSQIIVLYLVNRPRLDIGRRSAASKKKTKINKTRCPLSCPRDPALLANSVMFSIATTIVLILIGCSDQVIGHGRSQGSHQHMAKHYVPKPSASGEPVKSILEEKKLIHDHEYYRIYY